MKNVIRKLRTSVLFCVKWRYLIALLVFIFCVVFKLHGSSINEYNKMFNNSSESTYDGVIIGESRAIRSDEYKVHTPYYMSQYYNGFAKNSNMMSLEGQDMIIGYNAPVADITLLAKPFTWGYVLLGNEYGLSWYWCSKLILLLLVSFEICMIITRKNKKISLLGMLMITFAPAVQWWFVPHMVDVFFWGMAVLVLAYHFFLSQNGWKRFLFAILLPLAVITFVIALFPSVQLPIGLVMMVLFIALMIRDKKEIAFRKKDIWQIVSMSLFVFLVLGYTIWTSKDAISALLNTAYPGHRVSLGGDYKIKDLFTNITSFILPFKNITYSNSSEISSFVHFAPIFLGIYPIMRRKLKRNKNMLIGDVFVGCITVMIIFMLVGFPNALAKITGFSYINRMESVYGFVATLFTIWGVDMVWKKQIFTNKQILFILAIYGFLNVCFIGAEELSYLNWLSYFMIIFGLLILAYLMLHRNKKAFLFGMSVTMLLSGATVNPIAYGRSALIDHPLEKKVCEIATEEPDEYWLAIGDTRLASIGIANGARVLNAVNFYPDYGKWKLLDPEGEYDYVYNRYAHIETVIADDGKTKIMPVISSDIMVLEISYNDLVNKWPIKYLLTNRLLKNEKQYFRRIYDDKEGEYYIYERVDKK